MKKVRSEKWKDNKQSLPRYRLKIKRAMTYRETSGLFCGRAMRIRILLLMVALIVLLLYSPALPQQMTKGLNYLTTVQNLDGSWGNDASNTDPLPATFAVIETLQALNQTGTSIYANAISWLSRSPVWKWLNNLREKEVLPR